MKIHCPLCEQVIEVDDNLIPGQHILCPQCNEQFEYSENIQSPHLKDKGVLSKIAVGKQVSGCTKTSSDSKNRTPTRITLPQRKPRNAKKGGRGYGGIAEEIVRRFAAVKQEGFQHWYQNLSKTKKCVLIAFALFFALCLLVNSCGRRTETPAEKQQRELMEAVAKIKNYVSSETIPVDLSASLSDTGVFGLKWGEMPRNASYRPPCTVDYPISHGLYSRMTLSYAEDHGLLVVELHAPQRIEVPDFSAAPEYMRAGLRRNFVDKTCVPLFDYMILYAEQILHQRMKRFRGEIQLTGLPESGGLNGIVTMDIHGPGIEPVYGHNGEPKRSFMIMNLNHPKDQRFKK